MQPTNLQSEYIKDEIPSGARIFSEFSKHLIYHVFVVSSLIYLFCFVCFFRSYIFLQYLEIITEQLRLASKIIYSFFSKFIFFQGFLSTTSIIFFRNISQLKTKTVLSGMDYTEIWYNHSIHYCRQTEMMHVEVVTDFRYLG